MGARFESTSLENPSRNSILTRSGYTAEHLLHMSPDCAHYYIQAYLTQYLDPDVPDDTDIASLAGSLSGPSRYGPKFTSDQIEVVLDVFRFFEENKDAYWLDDYDLESIGKATRRLKTLGDSPGESKRRDRRRRRPAMWECQGCGEKHEDSFEACWNCGSSRTGEASTDFRRE